MYERRYLVGEQWYNLKPDAMAAYCMGSQHFRFWLEWERGTMNVLDLTIKFASYAHYIASREWAKEYSMPPALVCVAPDIAQERRVQRVAQARLIQCTRLEVWTTTEVLYPEHGPLAHSWVQSLPQPRRAAKPGSIFRQSMFDNKFRNPQKPGYLHRAYEGVNCQCDRVSCWALCGKTFISQRDCFRYAASSLVSLAKGQG